MRTIADLKMVVVTESHDNAEVHKKIKVLLLSLGGTVIGNRNHNTGISIYGTYIYNVDIDIDIDIDTG